jgi:hypothetical protein
MAAVAQDCPFTPSLTRIGRTFCVAASLVLACLSYGGRAVAQSTTYTYIGSPFTLFPPGFSCPPDCRITGSFTVAQPLSANSVQLLIEVPSFSFTDGVTTITDSSPNSFAEFFITTDANGAMVDWTGEVATSAGGPHGTTFNISSSTIPKDLGSEGESFIAGTWGIEVTLVDPVPFLFAPGSPPAITASPQVLADGGQVVQGAAADGVTQVLVRITNLSQGGPLTLNLLDDQGNPAPANGEDGSLFKPGTNPIAGQTSLKLTTQQVGQSNMAFAVYQAPPDFARASGIDGGSVSRTVTLQVKDQTGNILAVKDQTGNILVSSPLSSPLSIMRPPVFFIHGIWSKKATWEEFDSRMQALLPGLFTCRADYQPFNGYSVAFNTPFVLAQASSCLTDFKTKNQAAAAQLDFIAHSMGGLISNNMPTVPLFKSEQSYGRGYIHKLITVDTPYYGSPFAQGVSQSSFACKLILNLAGDTVDGAIEDLVPDSNLLNSLKPLPSLYYKHAISGELTEAQSLTASVLVDGAVIAAQVNGVTRAVLAACYSAFVTPKTAPPAFTFDAYFGDSSDLIVSKTSQLGPFAGPPLTDSQVGVSHMHVAIPFLDLTLFIGALDEASENPDLAVELLNSLVSSSSFLH